jgi:predicted nucleic acid-binding protein
MLLCRRLSTCQLANPPWLSPLETLDVARKFGEVRASLLDRCLGTPELGLLIASTALVHGLAVVTRNVTAYANIPGLTVADWLIP